MDQQEPPRKKKITQADVDKILREKKEKENEKTKNTRIKRK